ncbi:ERAD-associated protein [Nowakowskiella sp. JEL0078]|nr:ERAD-associated protein [Nowakowskiella sp. JEL0078]
MTTDDDDDLRRKKAVSILEYTGYKLKHTVSLETLVDMYLIGKYSHKRNVTKAYLISQHTAVTHGTPKSQRTVAFMYATSIGVERDYAKALLYYSFAALGGDTIAQHTLGYYHFKDIATPHSCEDSVHYYKLVATKVVETFKSGPPGGLTVHSNPTKLADTIMGGVFGTGASGPGQPKEATTSAASNEDLLELTIIEADKGDTISQFHVGQIYYYGTLGIEKNYALAAHYFLKAARTPVPLASEGKELLPEAKKVVTAIAQSCGYVGRMSWRGEGMKQNTAAARDWFEKGAKLENPMSWNGLGMMHMDGVAGLPKNTNQAVKYFTNAAKHDNPDAQVHLGEIMLSSERPDYNNIIRYFSAAARYNHILALWHLGRLVLEGYGDSTKRCLTALTNFKTLVEHGNWNDPVIHDAHKDFKKGDIEGSLIQYLMAAEQGYDVAQLNAAWLIDSGHYKPKSGESIFHPNTSLYEVALNLWNRAANQNANVDARVKMGNYFFYGLGTSRFLSTTENGTEVEQAKGKSNIMEILQFLADWDIIPKRILDRFKGDSTPDYEKAAMYYQVAAQTEYSALAMWNLGWMHENGIGVRKDYHLAKRLYDQALNTNPNAYLPVYLALLKLYIKSTWAYWTGGPGLGSTPALTTEETTNDQAEPLSVVPQEATPDEIAGWLEQEEALAEFLESSVIFALIGIAALLWMMRRNWNARQVVIPDVVPHPLPTQQQATVHQPPTIDESVSDAQVGMELDGAGPGLRRRKHGDNSESDEFIGNIGSSEDTSINNNVDLDL